LLLGHLLQVEINRGDKIVAGQWQHCFDLILNAAATINYNLAIAVAPTQVVVIRLLQTALTDHIAGFELLLFVGWLLELFRPNLADVANNVRERPIRRISALRLLLNA
jgi:hypothetical protein